MTASTQTYSVSGMTCEHCVASVTEELTEIPTVETVTVDLGDGVVTVSSKQPLTEADVRTAIETAGYSFNGASGR